ncbi:elongation of very long chain fatty acids protein, putative [Pediculus humanus corporis]|uniref:Elongation of very long chain fatty acids protein n=1 Tax=Pediculus humanus subsp. corporis TaxID=121224 RepID=E0VAZ6_PEDHC|nr:elongation of very long chain fatty acids protein, putative [Pediculus humanus corporis]EEB10552.1 elongation of very long chain fatty acids protein, putative [Pediculus humanus corporis]
MTSIYNNSISNFYNYIFKDLADPRTNDWFLIPSPMPGLIIIACYLYFVTTWGPRYMKDKKPYELKLTLIIYNFLQVLVSIYLVYEAIDGLWLRDDFSFRCQPVIFEYTEPAMREARGVYVYFIAKLTELLDTVFFVLRKKHNQISFLHMYHHTVMPMVSWGCVKYYPGGHSTFVGVINSFVHIIMYLYYMLSAFGPKFHKYLWWKKYITVLQMVQFLIVFLHNAQLLFTDCNYPKFSIFFVFPNAWFFLYLFNDFYVKAYRRKKYDENSGKLNNNDNKYIRDDSFKEKKNI